ncbi:MAG: hypothetical protein V7L31_29085 [Nostoc sp.]|uniref:hypothetical protein n=1 Tax=Nostoc sp. TaxID=1180 RepID=UPI002FF3BE7B
MIDFLQYQVFFLAPYSPFITLKALIYQDFLFLQQALARGGLKGVDISLCIKAF